MSIVLKLLRYMRTGLERKNWRGGFRFRGLYLPEGFPWRHWGRKTRPLRIIATNNNGNISVSSANFYLHSSGEREYYCG